LPIKKKICLLGAEAVGKTSLVRRFVQGIFTDRYLTTMGVKIDKKTVFIAEKEVQLIVWDLAGEDELTQLRTDYLRGASGYFLIVDGTRASTFQRAVELWKKATEVLAAVPFILVVNKSDLFAEWFPLEESLGKYNCNLWPLCRTSALDGSGVEEAFLMIARLMLSDRAGSTDADVSS
jgi:small GTP-binding protein